MTQPRRSDSDIDLWLMWAIVVILALALVALFVVLGLRIAGVIHGCGR